MKLYLVLGLNLLFIISCLSSTPDTADEKETRVHVPANARGTIERDPEKLKPVTTPNARSEGGAVDCLDCGTRRRLSSSIISFSDRIAPASALMVEASDRLLASMYQSCDVLKLKTDTIRYQPRELEHKSPACRPPARFPSYRLGAKTEINRDGLLASTYSVRDRRHNSLDCSGFIVSVLRAAGLKITPSEDNEINDTNTPIISTSHLQRLGTKDDCFQNVNFNQQERLREGDIVNWRIGGSEHAIIITRLGEDPFKIKGLNKSQCNAENIDYRNFDFEVAHSLGRPSTGPIQHSVAALMDVSSNLVRSRFMSLAIEACRAYHKDKTTYASFDNGRFKVLRHAGNTKPNCTASVKPPIKNEACYHQCIREI